MFLLNSFSLNMIKTFPVFFSVDEISLEQAKVLATACESAVGHADTAAVFASVLGVSVATNRATVELTTGGVVLVGQYRGPRLAEGATTLPEGATIQWLMVSVH